VGTALDFPIRRDRLHEQVAKQIQGLIIDESLHPGDKLPSERNFAERLGVSRTVIREAIRVLSAQGLAEARPGSGTYIRELSPNDAAAPIELLLNLRQAPDRYDDLHEVRRTLEVEIAGLAAERATDEDYAALEGAIEEIATHMGDPKHFVQYDLAFHSALAAATHNDLYSVLLAPITGLLLEFRLTAYHYNAQSSIEGALTHHRRILSRVKAHDPEGARQAMRDHLHQARSLMEAARKRAETSQGNR
jgi:GntR family transcriptional repressor for pyruvate dehydrogenase complex